MNKSNLTYFNNKKSRDECVETFNPKIQETETGGLP